MPSFRAFRAPHRYDKIGLLRPQCKAENGYREYSQEDLDKLQQILFFRQCGFSLERIKKKKLPSNPRFDRAKTFELQKKHLMLEKERIEAMLSTLERTLKTLKGEDFDESERKVQMIRFLLKPL